jgi:anti-sigma regulatory factor (Ser/Thr protein kinase)
MSPESGPVSQTYLPPNLTAPRQARTIVRHALASWGLGALSADAELLASELVANAAEHGTDSPIRLTILSHTEPNGQRGILCRVTDASPSPAAPQSPEPDSERGRGLQIVAALATNSGFTTNPHGKTAWFTLTAVPDRTASGRNPGYEAEPGT